MGVRGAGGTGGENPTIVDMARVECPAELVEMTQLKRSDDPDTFDIEEANRPEEYQQAMLQVLSRVIVHAEAKTVNTA